MHRTQHNRTNWLLLWLLANAVGGAIAGVISLRFQFLGDLVLAGLLIGPAQWFALRGHLPRAYLWPLVTAIGWPLANLAAVGLGEPVGAFSAALANRGLLWEVFWLNALRTPFVLGLLSLAQLPLLWSKGSQPWRWVIASLVAGVLVGAIGAGLCWAICDTVRGDLLGILLGAGQWLGYGLITGPVLLWIMKNRDENLRL